MTLIRDLGEQAFEERFGCDRFTATVLSQPLRLRRRAHVQPDPHDGVLADPARLLRLRRHGDRSAEQRLPHAGGVELDHPVHGHDDGVGPDHDRGVRRRPPRARRRDHRQRPVPDGHARQRPAVHPAGLRRLGDRRVRDAEGPPPGHGRLGARRLLDAEGEPVRGRPGRLAARALQGGQAGAGDLDADLRQQPLRRPAVPGHADDLLEPRPGRAAPVGDRRALRARGGPGRDDVRLRRRRRAHAGGARGGAGRVVGGRGDHGRRRRRRRRVLPRPRARSRRPATGRRSTSRAARGRRARR